MSDHVVAIIQARLGSLRFPLKVLADIGGKPMVVHVLERAQAIAGVHTVIAAIPDGETALRTVIEQAGFHAFEGPSDDVLLRYVLAAEATAADIVVRLTADCPLVPIDVAAVFIAAMQGCPSRNFLSAVEGRGGIDGFDVEVLRAWLLRAADREATDRADREHVTPWLYRHFGIERESGRSIFDDLHLSVNTPADLSRVQAVYAELPRGDYSMRATLIACARAGVLDYRYVV